MGSISVRPAVMDDLAAVAALFDAYRQFYDERSDPDGARAFVAQRLSSGDSAIFVAQAADATGPLLGFMQLYPSYSSTRMARAWILNDLFVMPAARKAGVARALLSRALEFARATGAAEMSLETASDNTIAQAAYEKLGWQRETRFIKYNLPLG